MKNSLRSELDMYPYKYVSETQTGKDLDRKLSKER